MVSVTGRDSDVFRNRVSITNLGEDGQTLTETRFLSLRRYGIRNMARSRCVQKPGPAGKISVRMQKLSQKPGFLVSGDMVSVTGRDRDVFRNRVSMAHLGEDAQKLF